jgi:hypothetical protein
MWMGASGVFVNMMRCINKEMERARIGCGGGCGRAMLETRHGTWMGDAEQGNSFEEQTMHA